jgi:predicted pyridoxine 5'-phosphate oxidase superfamily flavin-nucleotide-binding protein
MTARYAEIAFTPLVQERQRSQGSDRAYRRMIEAATAEPDRLGADERLFIQLRDSFYLGTVGQTGWPYVQHRGGPPGFLKVLDDFTIGFADYRGNRQYISTGNLGHDNRVSLFLMDYARQLRLKIFGRARTIEASDDRDLMAEVSDAEYPAKVERTVLITVDAYDWNCRQHITPRFTEDEIERAVEPMRQRIADLEADNARLRAELGTSTQGE